MTAVAEQRGPRLRRDIAVLMTGTAAGQAALLASTPLLTRLFDPSEVGTFGAFSALESILVVVACLRFDQALSLARSEGEARPLLRLALGTAVASGAAFGLLAALLPPSWRSQIGIDGLPLLPLLLAATIVLDAAGQALVGWAVWRRDLAVVATSRAALGVAQAGSQVGLGVVGQGSGGLAVGYLVGRAAAVWQLVRGRRLGPPSDSTPDEAPAVPAVPRWHYPVLAAPAALLNAAALQVPILLVAARYDVAAVAALVLAFRLVTAPMQLAGQSVVQALSARLAQVQDPLAADLRPRVRAAAGRLGLVGAAIAVPTMVLGPSVLGWLLGDDWRAVGRFAQLLAPATSLQLVVAPLAVVLAVKGRQSVQLAWDAARLVAVVAAIVLPAAAGWSVTAAVAAFGTTLAVAYVVLLALVWRAARPRAAGFAQAPS